MAYFFILGILNVVQWFNVNLTSKQRNSILFILFSILFLFAALRGTGNGDYYIYIRNASYINSVSDVLNNNFPMEIGFRLLAYFCNLFNLPYQWTLIIMNFISLTLMYKVIIKYSTNPLLSGMVFMPFYFMFDMQAARTAPAIAISMVGVHYLIEGKGYKFFLTILVASLFHAVAWVLIPIYFIRKYNSLNSLNLAFTLFLIPIAYIVDFVKIIISMLSFIGLGQFGNRLLNYVSDSTYGYQYSLFDPRFLLLIFIYIGAYYLVKNFPSSKRIEVYSLLIWLSILSIILLRSNTFAANRISSFFSVYMILLVPELLSIVRKKYGNILYLILYIILIIIFTVYSISIFINYPEYVFYFD